MSKLIVKERYAVIPNAIVSDSNLSLKAKGLFAFIQSKPDEWKFSAERIAGQCKEGVDSIKAGLKELENTGFLKRVKYQDSVGKWAYNYILLENKTGEKPLVENPPVENPLVENTPLYSKQDSSKQDYSKKEDTISESGFSNREELFETFWSAWPSGARKNKKRTEEWFLKNKPNSDLVAIMVVAIERQKQSKQWLKDSGDFIPHPTTWLNGRRWEDVVETLEVLNLDK
jgi:hypothetical protein